MNLRRDRKRLIIPVNAMSDVAFLLLIFIMLVALINYRREVKIDYPEAAVALRTSDIKNLEIWIDSEGGLYLDGVLSTFLDVEIAIGELVRSAPDTRVHIIADKNTRFEHINGVLQIMQLLQYRVVSLVVKES